MKAYKVVVETLFVRLPNQNGLFGFFSTIYVRAAIAPQAVEKACDIVRQKVRDIGEEQSQAGVFAVTLYIKDIWEIEESVFRGADSSGATFYPLRDITKFASLIRLIWLRYSRPYLVRDF